MIHEQVHERQQTKSIFLRPKKWWKKYLTDESFRMSQELEAYRAQYQFVKKYEDNKRKVKMFLYEVSQALANPIYGNMVSVNEAKKLIEERQNQPPNAEEEFLLKEGQKAEALAGKAQADTETSIAQTEQIQAETIETLSEIERKDFKTAIELSNEFLSGNRPAAQVGENLNTGS